VLALLAALVCLCGPAAAQSETGLAAYTEVWPPYVEAGDPVQGSVVNLVRIVLDDMGETPGWRRFDFAYSYEKVREGKAPLAFPYFLTPERETEVVFSAPLFEVTNLVFHNRRFGTLEASGLDGARFGRVAGYRYGDVFDAYGQGARVFASEAGALRALLDGEIDALPMTQSVAEATLAQSFPDELELIRPVEGVSDTASLHVIAPMSGEGRALIARFDASLARLRAAGVIPEGDPSARVRLPERTLARLVASEGFPMILARVPGEEGYLAMPPGARATIIEWSVRIREGQRDDRLFQTMTDETRVVMLSGPHVGRELLIRNMHLEIID
jgi:polar amino acid transport system substrate-binding protein